MEQVQTKERRVEQVHHKVSQLKKTQEFTPMDRKMFTHSKRKYSDLFSTPNAIKYLDDSTDENSMLNRSTVL